MSRPFPYGGPTDPRGGPGVDPRVHRRLEQVAWLMDRAFTVPGTNLKVGADAIIGLFPGVGDLATGAVQAWLVLTALQHYKVPSHVAMRMVGNVLLDIGFGSIPILGDFFDAAFKANTLNLRLLEPYRAAAAAAQAGGRIVDPANPPDFSPGFGAAGRPQSIGYVPPLGMHWGCLVAAGAVMGAAVLTVSGAFVYLFVSLLRR